MDDMMSSQNVAQEQEEQNASASVEETGGTTTQQDELDEFFPDSAAGEAGEETTDEQSGTQEQQEKAGQPEKESEGEGGASERDDAVEQHGRSPMIPRERFDQVYSQWRAEQEVSRRLMAENEQLRAQKQQEEADVDAESGEGGEEDDEEMDKLKQQLEDFPEVLAYVNKNSDKQQQRIAQLEAQLSALTNQIAPIQQSEQDRIRNDHFNKIHHEHPDAQDIVKSKEFAAWRDRQPDFLKRTYDGVLQSGTAEEVIGLFSAFKDQSGWRQQAQAQTKSDPRRDATVQRNIRESQSQPPAPTGAAGERSIRVTLPESQEDYERLSDAERLELLG